jgi:hypothetical protein
MARLTVSDDGAGIEPGRLAESSSCSRDQAPASPGRSGHRTGRRHGVSRKSMAEPCRHGARPRSGQPVHAVPAADRGAGHRRTRGSRRGTSDQRSNSTSASSGIEIARVALGQGAQHLQRVRIEHEEARPDEASPALPPRPISG